MDLMQKFSPDSWVYYFMWVLLFVLLEQHGSHLCGGLLTWTRDSGRLILRATSSLMKMSGYLVLEKSASRMSSCVRVKVVRSLRCFRGVAAKRCGGFFHANPLTSRDIYHICTLTGCSRAAHEDRDHLNMYLFSQEAAMLSSYEYQIICHKKIPFFF